MIQPRGFWHQAGRAWNHSSGWKSPIKSLSAATNPALPSPSLTHPQVPHHTFYIPPGMVDEADGCDGAMQPLWRAPPQPHGLGMLSPCLAPSHWLLLGCPFPLQAAGEGWDCFGVLLLLDIFSFKSSFSWILLAQGLRGLGNGALSCAALSKPHIFPPLWKPELTMWVGRLGKAQGGQQPLALALWSLRSTAPSLCYLQPCTMSARIKSSSSSSTDLSWCWAARHCCWDLCVRSCPALGSPHIVRVLMEVLLPVWLFPTPVSLWRLCCTVALEDLYNFFRFLDMSQHQQTSGQKLCEEQEMRELSGLVAVLDHSKA